MFTLAVQWGWVRGQPRPALPPPHRDAARTLPVQGGNRQLAAALDAAEDRRADIIRMCMLTGARLGEVRQARFEQFNLEHMSWSKPPTMTKQRRAHRVPISDETAAIVRQRLLLVPKGSRGSFPAIRPASRCRRCGGSGRRSRSSAAAGRPDPRPAPHLRIACWSAAAPRWK
jgi:integrase